MRCEPPAAQRGISLAHFTRPELIVPRLRDLDVAGIIEELSLRLHENRVIGDLRSFYHEAMNREFLADSALPEGFAIPHARSEEVRRLAVAIGRAPRPVVWGIKGSRAVEYIFLVAVPPKHSSEYLPVLADIASFCNERGMSARLRAASGAEGIFELVNQFSRDAVSRKSSQF